MVAASENLVAPGRHPGEPYRRGHGFGAGLEKPDRLDPRHQASQIGGQLGLIHR
jgi:hypothetical protein